MGWFNKKEEIKEGIPELPELPKLPELPELEENINEPLPKLPSFPNNSLGDKFSQNIIKDSIAGKKEEEDFDADDLDEEFETMHHPLRKAHARELSTFGEKRKIMSSRLAREEEPIFIRIDKFEESLRIFEKTKKQVKEMEAMLHNIKKIKEEEEKELNDWEQEILSIKRQIEKVDSDIFSKIE